jgi:CDP-diacylglycerol--glycerol-3-phosphate 3-phosphatidyltransferase
MVLFVLDGVWAKLWATVVFVIAALTDLADGYYARKYGVSTSFGKFFDPLADKILTSVAFIAFVTLGYVEMWMVLAIVIREFLITGLRTMAAYKGALITPTWWAKVKTFMQMSMIVLILLVIDLRTLLPATGVSANWLHSPAVDETIFWLMLLTVILTVATAVDYLVKSFYLFRSSVK